MKSMGIANLLLLAVLALASSQAAADPAAGPLFRELGHTVDSFQSAGVGRFATADVDRDGVTELVFGGTATSNILFVAGKKTDGSLGFKQAIVTEDGTNGHPSGYARVLAWRHGPSTQIVTVSITGTVRIYGGWPLTEQSHFVVADGAVSAAIGDVDADGHDDLVVLTSNSLFAYALDDGSQEWTKALSNGSDVALAQLDTDPALEIIVAGPKPGLVLDGVTRTIDWSYIDGFGTQLATGVFTAGGKSQWATTAGGSSFTVFGANPWSPLWDFSSNQGITTVATGDLDGNGIDSILYADGQWDKVHVIDPVTHQERLRIDNGGSAVNAVAVGDINGDGTTDIAFSSEDYSPDKVALTITDGETGATLWTFSRAPGPYATTAIGDVDGDGRDDIVAVSGGSSGDTSVAIFDAATGAREWRNPASFQSGDVPFAIDVCCVKLLPRAGKPGMNIVLAGEGSYYGKIVVLDGVSKSVVRQIDSDHISSLSSRTITGIALMDFDHDGIDDYVVATQPVDFGASGTKLKVIAGASDQLLWESVAMGNGFSDINDVFIIPPKHPGGASELVAVLPDSLRAYNSDTHLLDWVLVASNDGAAYIDAGLATPEIMLYEKSGAISFYDAATQAYLRGFATAAPLSGVTVLQGDARTLLIAANQRLSLVDGSDGSVLATSTSVGPLATAGQGRPDSSPAAIPLGDASWQIALPTPNALWRMRLDASDRIFLGTFDTP